MFAFKPCPKCNRRDRDWLATWNEWEYYCAECDIRYNAEGEVLEGN